MRQKVSIDAIQPWLIMGIVLMSCVAKAQAQWSSPDGLEPRSNEVPYVTALANARGFLRAAGMSDQGLPVYCTFVLDIGHRRTWHFDLGGFRIDLRATDGSVLRFDNYRHMDWQVKPGTRTGARFFQSDQAAKAYIEALARKLNVPTTAKLKSYSRFEDYDPVATDTNPAGHINAVFQAPYGGYGFVGNGNSAVLSLDPQDGTLVRFAQQWDIAPDPPK